MVADSPAAAHIPNSGATVADQTVRNAVANVAALRPWQSVVEDLGKQVLALSWDVVPSLANTNDECRQVLGDSTEWSRAQACELGWSGFGSAAIPPTSLPSLDGPGHRRIRKVINAALAANESFFPAEQLNTLVRNTLAHAHASQQPSDLVANIVKPLAMEHLARILGTDVRRLDQVSEHLALTFSYAPCDNESWITAAWQLAEVAMELLDYTDTQGPSCAAIIATADLTRREKVEALMTLLTAGFETVSGQLAIILLAVLAQPILAKLAADEASVATVVRHLVAGIPVAGLLFPRAKQCPVESRTRAVKVPDVGSAAREHRIVTAAPERYGLAFGFGEHHCPGKGIALNFLHTATKSLATELARYSFTLVEFRWSTGRSTHYPSHILVESR